MSLKCFSEIQSGCTTLKMNCKALQGRVDDLVSPMLLRVYETVIETAMNFLSPTGTSRLLMLYGQPSTVGNQTERTVKNSFQVTYCLLKYIWSRTFLSSYARYRHKTIVRGFFEKFHQHMCKTLQPDNLLIFNIWALIFRFSKSTLEQE